MSDTRATPTRFRIQGMDCAEEIAVLKRAVGPLVGGGENLGFDLLNATMTIPAGSVRPEIVIESVAAAGLKAEPWTDSPVAAETTRDLLFGRTGLTLLSGLLLGVGLIVHLVAAGWGAFGSEAAVPLVSKVPYALAAFAGAWLILPKAWIAARSLRPDMNLLMVVAVAGAIGIGEWLEATTVAFLFAVSLALESWSVGRARRAVAALMNLTPPTVRIVAANGATSDANPRDVPVGTRFLVRPGDRLALDGVVREGESGVDQSPMTGESVPVLKRPGDEVFAGTVNGDGALTVESIRLANDTLLARTVRSVVDAQARRSPSEKWVEKFARIYTPAVLALAVTLAIMPPLLFGGSWSIWFYRALVLLVIACPCALVISTPVSIVAALASAARNGVLIKGGEFVEAPARLKCVALDKTGTLTRGKPAVVAVVPMSGHTETKLTEIAAALEAQSTHPIALAILAFAKERNQSVRPAEGFQIIPGKGASGLVNGESHWLGSHRYLEERKQETPEVHEQLEALAGSGKTVVVIGNERHVCGFIGLADQVRPESVQAVRALHAAGIRHVVMLTGDNRGTAQAIARETGVDAFRAELLPADKVTAIESLLAEYGTVAMVGDGVNDAPALARSTLGVAMGAMGSDAAIETADVALMSDDLGKLPWLIRHSRRTLAVIRQNILFALGVKAVFVILTASGYASMWGAIAADAGASLVVVFNGLRLLRSE